jgi:hypothetical protein
MPLQQVPSKSALLDDVLASVQASAQDIDDPSVCLHQDQNTARQLDGVAVDRTFTDSASGKT